MSTKDRGTEDRELRLNRGKDGIYSAPDSGFFSQREALKRAFPGTNTQSSSPAADQKKTDRE